MSPEELAAKLEASLTSGSESFTDVPQVGPTRRLRLRANRERLTILEEFLTLAYEAIHAEWADLKQRAELVTALRALARRIEEGP